MVSHRWSQSRALIWIGALLRLKYFNIWMGALIETQAQTCIKSSSSYYWMLPTYESSISFGAHDGSTRQEPSHLSNMETVGRNREIQTYLVRGFPCFVQLRALSRVCKLSLDDIEPNDEDQDKLFTQYTINTVYASYAAAQHRLRQYSQLMTLLQREVDEWAAKVEKASDIMPEYKPVWLLLHGQSWYMLITLPLILAVTPVAIGLAFFHSIRGILTDFICIDSFH